MKTLEFNRRGYNLDCIEKSISCNSIRTKFSNAQKMLFCAFPNDYIDYNNLLYMIIVKYNTEIKYESKGLSIVLN